MRRILALFLIFSGLAWSQITTLPPSGGSGGGDLNAVDIDTSAELKAIVGDETGSGGALVFATSPTLTTPNLGTPSAVTLTNGTGLPISTGVSGLGTGVATALAIALDAANGLPKLDANALLLITQLPLQENGGLDTCSGELCTDIVDILSQMGVNATNDIGNGTQGTLTYNFKPSGTQIPFVFTSGALDINAQVTVDRLTVEASPGESFASTTGYLREQRIVFRSNAVIEADQGYLSPVFLAQEFLGIGCKVTSAGDDLTFNIQRDDGTPANIFTSNITATTTFQTWCEDSSEQILSETNFATHVNWDATGDFVDSGGNGAYTHSTGAGTLTQVEADQAAAPVDGLRYYRFNYTIGSVTGDPACTITTGFASGAEALTITNGAKSLRFLGSATPGDFVISCTSTSGGFTIDDVSLVSAPCNNNAAIEDAEDNLSRGDALAYNYVSDTGDPDGLSCVAILREE